MPRSSTSTTRPRAPSQRGRPTTSNGSSSASAYALPSPPLPLSLEVALTRRVQHAQALEALLAEHPEHGPWLAQHGFDAPALVRALRWAPAEHLRAALGRTDAPRRARAAAQLRAEHRRNLRRMEENLARALPVSRL